MTKIFTDLPLSGEEKFSLLVGWCGALAMKSLTTWWRLPDAAFRHLRFCRIQKAVQTPHITTTAAGGGILNMKIGCYLYCRVAAIELGPEKLDLIDTGKPM